MSYLRNIGRAILGRQEGIKASAVGNMIARYLLGQPAWTGRDFTKLGKEGYQQNPIVSRSIRLIAESAAAIPFTLYKGKGDRRTEIEEHPLLDLLANPNPGQDGADLLIALYSHLMIAGNAYCERTEEKDVKRMELYALRPDRVKLIPGETGQPMGYEYEVNGAKHRYDMDVDAGLRPILHLKTFNPVDDWYGMSPLDPASRGIDCHNAAGAWNHSLLLNGAAPSGALVYTSPSEDKVSGGRMPEAMYEATKKQIDEMMTGPRNAGRPLLLEGGLDYKAIGLDPEKMQFVDSKTLAAREIAWALGVPPLMLGLPGDNTHANYAEANMAFHRQTVIPLAQRMARQMTHWFAMSIEKGMRLEANIDDVDALSADREAQWKRVAAAEFLTINEKREALGYEKVDGGDDVYIGAGQLPINGDAAIPGGAADGQGQDTGVVPFRRGVN